MSPLVHVRVVAPGGTHAALLADLERHVAVCNIVFLPGVARQPDGDLVLFDVAREATDELVTILEQHGIRDHGSFTLEHAELSGGVRPLQAARDTPGGSDDAAVWQEVDVTVRLGAGLNAAYLSFFVVGAVIAAVGILADSPILIVGAMVVGPEYGPLAAMAYAVERRDTALWWTALRTFCFGAAAGVAASTALTLVLLAFDRIPEAFEAGRPFTRFISDPDLFAPIVAGAAAVAGVLSLTLARSGTLVGVLISVTTIPAVADIGVGVATGSFREVWGSLGQLTINVSALVLVGAATFAVQRRLQHRARHRPRRAGVTGH